MNTSTHNEDLRFLELLRRWLEGDFTRADEQELQELTRADTFRREAMDGFMEMPERDYATHLASLQQRLRERTGSKTRYLFPPQLLAAVAGIALVIGIVIFFPRSEREQNEQIAQTKPQDLKAPDSIVPSKAPSESEPLAATEKRFDKGNAVGSTSGPGSVAGAGEMKKDQLRDQTETRPDDIVFSERASREEIPVQSAPPEAEQDEDAKSKSKVADKMKNAPTSQQNIPYSPTNTYPAIPSRPGDAAKAKKSSTAKENQPQDETEPLPVGGWAAFQEYIRKNARLPEAARNNNVSGMVRLVFEVDNNGKPVKIKVIRELGHGCDEEAVRLLEGWKWTPGTKPATVDIPFVR